MAETDEIEALMKRIKTLEAFFSVVTDKVVNKERRARLAELRKRRYFNLDEALRIGRYSAMSDVEFESLRAALEKWRPTVDLGELGLNADAKGGVRLFERGFESGYERGTREARARMVVRLLETYSEDALVEGEEFKPLGIRRGEIRSAKEWLAADPVARTERDSLDSLPGAGNDRE